MHQANSTDQIDEPAVWHLPSHLYFWLLAAIVLGLDLWSKAWAFEELETSEVRPVLPGMINFQRSLNDGAVFGFLSGYTALFIIASMFALGLMFYLFAHSDRRQRLLHIALGLILAGAVGNLYDRAFVIADVVRTKTGSGEENKVIGRIVSEPDEPVVRIGDYPDGNNERSFARASVEVGKQGVVRDFIKLVPKFPDWVPRLAGRDVWPWVFNVADAALVCGVGLLLVHMCIDRKPRSSRS
jgi:lipoprotein signal peptidase